MSSSIPAMNGKKVKKIKHKLKVIFFLNCTDLIFTWILLFNHDNLFYEINGFAKKIIYNIPASFLFKMIPLTAILIYWNYRLKKADDKGIKLSNITANLCLLLYSIINIMHLFNLFIVYLFCNSILLKIYL